MENNTIKAMADMAQFRLRVLTFSDVQVAAGQRVTGIIGTRKTIRAIYFDCRTAGGAGLTEAQIAADVGSVVIRANGVVLRDITAQEALDLYQHKKNDMGAHTVAGIIPIDFQEGHFDLSVLNSLYGLGMMLNDRPVTLTYEIVLSNPLAQLSSMRVRVLVDDREQELGIHTRITRHNRSFAGTGLQDISDMPKGDGSSTLLAYHIEDGAGTIDAITVKDGDVEIYSDMPVNLLDVLLNDAGRKTQAGYVSIPFNLDNDPRSNQPIGPQTASWLVQPNWSVTPGGAFTILEERLHTRL